MKKILTFVLVSAFLLVFASCNKNDSPASTNDKDLLIGEWTRVSSKSVYYDAKSKELATQTESSGTMPLKVMGHSLMHGQI